MNTDRILDACQRTQTVLFILGPPGVGKTATVTDWAARHGLRCWTIVASLRETSDFGGLPVLGTSEAGVPSLSFAPPRFATEAAEKGGLIFRDEISTAPPAVQAALLRAVMDKAFGDLELDPARVMIVAAGNPPDLAAGGWDLAPPLANRFVHYEYALNAAEWAADFPDYWGGPPTLKFGREVFPEADWGLARSLVAAFVRARPEWLLRVPDAAIRRGGAWPSPRSWDFASRHFADARRQGQSPADALPLIAGCIGEGPAVEFIQWVRELDLPDPDALLADPTSYRHPPRGDQAYAVLSAVTQAAISRLDASRWQAAWAILAAAADAGGADVAAAAGRRLAAKYSMKLPLPVRDMTAFTPMLTVAGLLPSPVGPGVKGAGAK